MYGLLFGITHNVIDEEPDHGALQVTQPCVILALQVHFQQFARWHVLELEHESPQHVFHCTAPTHTHAQI